MLEPTQIDVNSLSQECVTILPLSSIPSGPAWVVILKDGSVKKEGDNDLYWPSLNQEELLEVIILGVRIPVGDSYTFAREALASPGEQPTVTAIVATSTYKGIEMKFVFKVMLKR